MLAAQTRRKTREYSGPTPHSVAIRAKMPSSKLPENLILERRKRDEKREEAIKITKYHEMMDLKSNWERTTDHTLLKNTVVRRVHNAIRESKLKAEERRERLRKLLSTEEEAYIREMEAMQETVEERQEKMVKRAKLLKEKREKERLQIVEDKLDQQWRNQCEELRSILSRRHQDEVCVDRVEQLAYKAEMEKKRQEQEAMYAMQWEKDRLAKAAREEKETQQQIERNREMVEVLRTQTASLAAKEKEESRLREEEAKLLKEERELRKLEEERALQYKRVLQKDQRETLEKSVKLKMKREAKLRQEELALDMKILEQLLEESRNEAEETFQRKLRLKDEEKKYRVYLKQQYEEEQRREKELDRLVEEDVAAMWAKRMHQWRLEKEARHRLMQDVMETRRKQLQDKLQSVVREREEVKRDREEMFRMVEEHNRMEEERIAKVKLLNKNHAADLLAQIDHIKSLKLAAKDEEDQQHQEGLRAEEAYQKKLKQVLSTASSHQKTHPKRLAHRQKAPQLQVVGSKVK